MKLNKITYQEALARLKRWLRIKFIPKRHIAKEWKEMGFTEHK